LICFVLAAVILLGSGSAGCLGEKTPAPKEETAPVIVVDYYRNGGSPLVSDRLVIFDNGAGLVVTRNASRNINLNSTEMKRIGSIFEQAQFSTLSENYPSHYGRSGLYQYSVSYMGKIVTLDENAYPADVKPVIDELNRIISESGS
jgi:hypothetical protein